MTPKVVLSDYIGGAMQQAEYDKPEDGSFGGSIPERVGVKNVERM